MSAKLITKENFDDYLKDLGKIYRKLSGLPVGRQVKCPPRLS